MFFRDIVGHSELKRRLTEMVDSGRIPHAQLYTGAEGVGKLALALAVAQYICCEHREGGEQSDRQDTARNKFKRTHFYSFLKFSGVNIEKVCEVSPAWANLFAHIAEPKPRTP